MSGTKAPNDIVLFWYRASPYGRKITWYLALRNIGYAECRQPSVLPRPDMEALGVRYRRSPVMAIGKDIYVDTRLIISKLEELFPVSAEHPALSSRETAGLTSLLQGLSGDTVFSRVAAMIPPQAPMLKDPKFLKDRADFMGGSRALGSKIGRQESIVHMRHVFEVLETLFADGRQWVAGTPKPSLADVEGIWPIDWLITDLLPPKEYFSEEKFPKVFAWRSRFRTALEAAVSKAPKPLSLRGEQAVKLVTSAAFVDKDLVVDPKDPMQLQQGTIVELFPTDSGFTHQDKGALLNLNAHEIAVGIKSPAGVELHVHAPRWLFRVREPKVAPQL